VLARLKARGAYLVIAPLLVLVVLAPFDWFLGDYTALLIFMGIHTMVTVGLCLLMGYTGQVSLGQAAFYGLGAYGSAILTTKYDVNPWLAMVSAAAITGAFAYIVGYLIFRLKGNYLAMATLGLGLVIVVLFEQLDGLTNGVRGITGIPRLSIGDFVFDTAFRRYFLVWFFCLATLLLAQNMVRSRTGRALRAIHGSEAAAESIGVNSAQFKVKIFVLAAVFASLAGSLYAHNVFYVSPGRFGFLFSVILVVMAVIGGLASIWGAIFGTAVVRLLSDKLLIELGGWDMIIYGLILIAVMIFVPQGLFVGLRDTYEHWRLRRTRRGAMT
jgi:branched-chain amino acid transport system permease protein